MPNGQAAYLVIRLDDGFGDVFQLRSTQRWTIGRAATSRIVLKDEMCSREHAEEVYSRITGQAFPASYQSGDRLRVMHAGPKLLDALTFFFNLWLMELNKNDRRSQLFPRIGKRLAKLEKYYIPSLTLLAFVFLTQSRGPMLGAALGFLVMQCTRFKTIRQIRIASVFAIILLVVAVAGAFVYFQQYTSPAEGVALTEQQESAMYRKRLLENYQPALEEGGWLGWGIQSYPVFPGQKSIDNDFLLVQLIQGRLGITLWYIILAESLWNAFRNTWKAKNHEDIVFAFAHLAGLLTFWLTLTTVYLGEQLPQIARPEGI